MRARKAATVWGKLAWFVGLWLVGVCAVGAVGLIIRSWLN